MIVVDTSVFMAVFGAEGDAAAFSRVLSAADMRAMSAGNYLESAILAETRFGGREDIDGWIRERRIEIIPVDHGLAELAADAFARFGKGRHPASLNYGDCFAYALAKHLRAPLLFKGEDFAKTDVESALT